MKKKILAIAVLTFILAGACIQTSTVDGGDADNNAVSQILQKDNFRSVIKKNFDASLVKSMHVSTVSADVEVMGDATRQATVEVLAKGSNNKSLSAAEIQQRLDKYYNIITELNGSQLNVKVEFKVKRITNNESLALKFILHTPASADAKINSVSGDIELSRAANTELKTTSGDIEIGSLSGDATAASVSGDIEAKSIQGNFAGRTTSGDIQAGRVGALMNASSVSGDIKVVAGKLGQDVKMKTVSGDIKLTVTEKAGMNLTLNTLSGDMNISELGMLNYETKSRRRIVAEMGGGGSRLQIETVSGDIHIGRN